MFSPSLYLRFHLIQNKIIDSIVFRFVYFIDSQIFIHITQIVITTFGSRHQTLTQDTDIKQACKAKSSRSKEKKLNLQSYTVA